MDAQQLPGTTALVTGASRGFSRGIAIALSRAGARVTGVARDRAGLEELRGLLGDGFTRVVADAADPVAAGQLIDRYPPRILVLNAGRARTVANAVTGSAPPGDVGLASGTDNALNALGGCSASRSWPPCSLPAVATPARRSFISGFRPAERVAAAVALSETAAAALAPAKPPAPPAGEPVIRRLPPGQPGDCHSFT
jgi:hypothetical protein